MSVDELRTKLLNDLRALNINTDGMTLVVKPYSKSYNGRYFPKDNRIFLYAYRDPNRTCMYPYSRLMKTLLHEVVHFIQWNDPEYVRVKGIMHNEEFYRIYNSLERQYKRKVMMNRVKPITKMGKSCP